MSKEKKYKYREREEGLTHWIIHHVQELSLRIADSKWHSNSPTEPCAKDSSDKFSRWFGNDSYPSPLQASPSVDPFRGDPISGPIEKLHPHQTISEESYRASKKRSQEKKLLADKIILYKEKFL